MKINIFFKKSLFVISLIITIISIALLIELFNDNYNFPGRLDCLIIVFTMELLSFILYKNSKKTKIKKDRIKTKQYEFDFIEFNNPKNTLMYPTLKQSIVLLFVVIIIQSVCSLCFTLAASSIELFQDTAVTIGLSNLISLSCVIYHYTKKNGASIKKIASINSIKAVSVIPLTIVAIALSVVLSSFSVFLQKIAPLPQFLEAALKKLTIEPQNYVFSIITLCIIAPITEELLFRGLILRSFMKNYSIKKGILLSSFLFASLHANPWQGIPAVVLGIYFSIIDIKLDSILPSIFSHFVYNLLIFLISINLIKFSGTYQFLALALSSVVLIASFFVFKFFQKNRTVQPQV